MLFEGGARGAAKLEDELAAAVVVQRQKAAGAFCSFSSSTPVQMAGGTTKPIGDVKVGDWVRATDPISGQTTDRLVGAKFVHQDNNLTDLVIRDLDGQEKPFIPQITIRSGTTGPAPGPKQANSTPATN
ncbi:hypothetical protein ACFQX7_27010 [Luedemannella flava]